MMIQVHRPATPIAKITELQRSKRRQSSGASRIRLAALLVLFPLVAAAEQPNFVVIFADDLGYGDLGAYGSETIRTPNLDRMAAEGMRFTDFYATAPFCSPSRASLLTGRYPVRAGVPYVLFPTELTGLPPAEITIAEILSDEGYATAAIGKWHLGWPRAFRAQRHGFDFFYGLPYSNDMLKWEPDDVLRPQHAFWSLPLLDNDEIVEAPVNQHTLTWRYTERAPCSSSGRTGTGRFSCTSRTPSPTTRSTPRRSLRDARHTDCLRTRSRNSTGAWERCCEQSGSSVWTKRPLSSSHPTTALRAGARGGGRWGRRSSGGSAGGLRGQQGGRRSKGGCGSRASSTGPARSPRVP